jgi:uncharacterized protein YndB with AHSA1/START domain
VNDSSATGSPRGLLLTRGFASARERVWEEWTKPERFAKWYGGRNAEIPVATVDLDVREGGEWRATMFAGAQRREIRWWGRYLEVVVPKLLVFTLTDQTDDEFELVTVVLSDLGGSDTEMIFRQRGGLPDAMYRQAEKGWSRFFDVMAENLARRTADEP